MQFSFSHQSLKIQLYYKKGKVNDQNKCRKIGKKLGSR